MGGDITDFILFFIIPPPEDFRISRNYFQYFFNFQNKILHNGPGPIFT